MTATVLVVDDDGAIRTVVRQTLARAGYDVRTTDTAAGLWKWIEAGEGDVVVSDVILPDENGLDLIQRLLARRPGLPVIVMSAQNTLSTAVRATEVGAFEYLPKPFDINELKRAVDSAVGRLRSDVLISATAEDGEDVPLIGRSPAMQDVYRTMARVVPTDLTVLLLGESGTGKELVARALHDLGGRRAGPFVAINMAAIPHELIESELFGHERGAFTGAAQRAAGRFEQAEGGTLFLDEIGDMPLDAQTRLLRVLQEGRFTSVGGSRVQKTDVRIIAATNKDLTRAIETGRFREDLYYRLNVVPLRLPPLRARAEDIPDLARHFLRQAARLGLPHKSLDPAAIAWMTGYAWPGNVRELENLMRRLAALTRDDQITAATIIAELGGRDPAIEDRRPTVAADSAARSPLVAAEPAGTGLADAVEAHLERYFATFRPDLPPDGVYDRVLEQIERPLLSLAMAATRNNQLRAARLLGLNRNTLRKKLGLLNLRTGGPRRR